MTCETEGSQMTGCEKAKFNLSLFSYLLFGLCIFLQETAVAADHGRHWSISVLHGGNFLGPGSDIESALIRDGYDDDVTIFTATTRFPLSKHHGSELVAIRRNLTEPYAISLHVANIDFAETVGNKSLMSLFETGRVGVSSYGYLIAPVASTSIFGALRFGVGPALYFLEATAFRSSVDPSGGQYDHTRLGALFDVSLETPLQRRFFIESRLQFRFVGSVDNGPFTAQSIFGTETLNATSVNYDHFFFAIGLGGRF
ncbi:MAG: hypothetical protein IH914_07480 [candidate division Zixibacteria bacterium]|nr:hypothetical protein [candidate division Zixibacteria bacterium]